MKITTTSFLSLSSIVFVTTSVSCLERRVSSVLEEKIELNFSLEEFKENLKKINIENYQNYFKSEGDSINQEQLKMSKSTLANLMSINDEAIDSFTLTKSFMPTSDGFVNFDFDIKLTNKYTYQNSNKIELKNISSQIFDPNSEYNLSFSDIINENQLWSFNKLKNYPYETYYVPKIVTNLTTQDNAFGTNSIAENVKKISFKFSSLSSEAHFGNGAWRKNKGIEELDFSNLTFFNLAHKNSGRYIFREMENLKTIDLTNNTSLTAISEQMLAYNKALVEVKLKGCTSLTKIEIDAFLNCTSIEVLDFSDSPINFVDDSAFSGCTNLRTIYVKDETIKELFLTALSASGLNDCQVLIKN